MRPVEGVLLILAIVANTLAWSFVWPSTVIYFGSWFWILQELDIVQPSDLEKVCLVCFIAIILDLMILAPVRFTIFLDYAIKEFVPMEGQLHSAVDKVLKGIAWTLLTVSVYKIYSALPLGNPYSGEEFRTIFFWTFVFIVNIDDADFSTTRQESLRRGQRRTSTHNPNYALLTPPNQSWNPMDAFLAILLIVSDVMSNYLVPSLTIFIKNYLLEKVYWPPANLDEGSANMWLFIGLIILPIYFWVKTLSILSQAFLHLAPPGGIHRSTIVQIVSTLNGLWFFVTFYNLSLDLPMTSDSLDSDGVMTSLGHWGLTFLFLFFKQFYYQPLPALPPIDPNDHRFDHLDRDLLNFR